MKTTTEQTLPVFDQRQLAEEAAKVLILSGELLSDRSIDVQSTFFAHGSNEGLYLDMKRQKQDVQSLDSGEAPRPRFVLKKDDPLLGGSAECFKETSSPRDGVFDSVERIVLDEHGRKVRVTEQRETHRDEYERVEIKRASVRTILAMAREATANTKPYSKRDLKDPLKKGLSGGENMVMLPEAFVPVLGKLAVVAGDFVLNRVPETNVDAEVEINAWCQGMYGAPPYTHPTERNKVHLWGVNRETQVGATFECDAYPLGSNELAVVTANMVVDNRSNGPAKLTKYTLVKNSKGNLVLESKVKEAGMDPKLTEEQPADLDTIVALAQTAVQLVRSEIQA